MSWMKELKDKSLSMNYVTKRRKCWQEKKHCDRGSLGTYHPRFLFKESLQEGKKRMIIGWSTPSPSLIEGGNAKEGKLSKMEQLEILCQVGYNKGRWLYQVGYPLSMLFNGEKV